MNGYKVKIFLLDIWGEVDLKKYILIS